MKKHILILVAGLVAHGTVPADAEWTERDGGRLALVSMQAAPFPHESRAEGHTRNEVVYPAADHYSDSTVGVFLPGGFDGSRGVNLIFYFHGHNNHVAQALDQFDLAGQVARSGRNALLVFPQGPRNVPDSSGGRMEEPGAFAALAEEVLTFLQAEGIVEDPHLGQVVFSGHSGAFRVLSFGVEHGGLEEHLVGTYLLDASYGRTEQFTDWIARRGGEGAQLRSVFTNHLAAMNVLMMTTLGGEGVPYLLYNTEQRADHSADATGVHFVHTTTMDHNGTVGLLEEWLSTSPLPAIIDQ